MRVFNFKKFLLPACIYFTHKFISNKNERREKMICFSDLEENIKKQILKKNTDVFIWGKGYVNNTVIYTNFHPHRIKRFLNFDRFRDVPKDIIDITFNEHMAACIDKNFNLYAWKEQKLNSEKSEEINNHERSNVVRLAEKLKVTNVTFTHDKLFILDKNGNVYFYNLLINQTASQDFLASSIPEPEVQIDRWKLIHIKELKNIQMIATGRDHFIALDKEGKVYGMGDDSYGQLGQGNFNEQREQQMKLYNNFVQRRERLPKLIDIPEKAKKVVCGENHTLVLSVSGNVYGFGYNRFLQISNDPMYRQGLIGLNKPSIIPIDKFKSYKVTDIAASRNCSFFTCKNEKNGTYHFFSAGEGLRGQLGQNLIKHMSDVEEMPDISGLVNAENFKPFEPLKLKCGMNHCLLLFKNPRALYVWGNNEFGELGTKDRVFYESPIPMLEEYTLPFKIINIGTGANNSAFICEKVDPVKKKQILAEDQKIYEEELSKIKKRKKRTPTKEEQKQKLEEEEEEKSSLRISFENLYNKFKKYV